MPAFQSATSAGVEVVLGGEVAVDGALGVFGAEGDLLDGDRLPVVAVHQRDGGVEQRRFAQAELAGLAFAGGDDCLSAW